MRRYLKTDIDKRNIKNFDVVIIGNGMAGLYTALNIDEKLRCVVISKNEFKAGTSSYLAQGGIAAVMDKDDHIEKHREDTITAGAGACDPEAVDVLVKEGPKEIAKLINAGMVFDTDESGGIHLTREGGHSSRRILHCGGDSTGKHMLESLIQLVANRPNVEFVENTGLVDILTFEDRAIGVLVSNQSDGIYLAPHIVICSGGIGQIYGNTTNPISATGDGIAAAIRAGAKLKDMEFVQFHPTALYSADRDRQCFLISEAVRGEGGKLVNHKNEYFMAEKHSLGDLAPRDIVAREIINEMYRSHSPFVYLDVTHLSKEFLMSRFPKIFGECKLHGLDISKQFIPVHPVQHYFMGGIQTDLHGRTNISGLYACGEAACTGVHGANRLASNSLLECLVFGRRCAEFINGSNFSVSPAIKLQEEKSNRIINSDVVKHRLQQIMSETAGIIRSHSGLQTGREKVEAILGDLDTAILSGFRHVEAYNMALVSLHILRACLSRKESIGAHYRGELAIERRVKVC